MGKITLVERMAKVETKIDDIKSNVSEIKRIVEKQDDKFENLNKKFASKWVEKVLIGVIIGAVIIIIRIIFKT